MRAALFCLMTVFSLNALAIDSGDKNCLIVMTQVVNRPTSCCGNRYEAVVAVRKSLTVGTYKNADVRLMVKGLPGDYRSSGLYEQGDYTLHTFRLPHGANYETDVLEVIPFLTDGQDRIFDNNFGPGMVVLNSSNKWTFQQTACKLN